MSNDATWTNETHVKPRVSYCKPGQQVVKLYWSVQGTTRRQKDRKVEKMRRHKTSNMVHCFAAFGRLWITTHRPFSSRLPKSWIKIPLQPATRKTDSPCHTPTVLMSLSWAAPALPRVTGKLESSATTSRPKITPRNSTLDTCVQMHAKTFAK